MTTAVTRPKSEVQELHAWQTLVEQLFKTVESWAKDRGWGVQRDIKQIEESRLGKYAVPVLSILAPAGQIHLDPVARFAAKSNGRVDLLAWPSLNRMLLIREHDAWKIKTDSGVDWPEQWSEKTFSHLVELLHFS